jgi:hypothetical protein
VTFALGLMLEVSRTNFPLMRRGTPGPDRTFRCAIFCAVFTILFFSAAHLLFDYFGTEHRSHQTLAFLFVATLILVNYVWKAVGPFTERMKLRRCGYRD